MRKIFKRAARLLRHVRSVGLSNTVMLYTLPKNTERVVNILGYEIVVRARTPDLDVAIESLMVEYTFLDDLLPSEFNGLIVDAGGYIGTAAIAFASRFPSAHVVSIEPSSENLRILRANIAMFPNVEVRHAALGASAGGTVTLRNRSTGAWGYTIVKGPDGDFGVSELEDVRLTSLDEIEGEFGRNIAFLKLDIEGGEKQIFEANDAKLQSIPFVFIELHERIITGCVAGFREFSQNRWVMRLSREKFVSIQSNQEKIKILGQFE